MAQVPSNSKYLKVSVIPEPVRVISEMNFTDKPTHSYM